jgi:hypothetical protein
MRKRHKVSPYPFVRRRGHTRKDFVVLAGTYSLAWIIVGVIANIPK